MSIDAVDDSNDDLISLPSANVATGSSFTDYALSSLQTVGEFFQKVNVYLSIPFYRSTEVFLSYYLEPAKENETLSDRATKISKLALTALFSPFTIALHCIAGASMVLGKIIAPKSYCHIVGKEEEKMGNEFSIGSWNICSYWGGLPTVFGGCTPARERWDQIADKIKEMDYDILVLEEVAFEAGLNLADRLKEHYSHMYTNIIPLSTHISTSFTSACSELFVATKYPVLSTKFIPFPEWKDYSIKHGIFVLETEKCFLIAGHFPCGDSSTLEVRERHSKIMKFVEDEANKLEGKPTFLAGDLNIRYEEEDGGEYSAIEMEKEWIDPYMDQYPEHNEKTATCTKLHPLIGKNSVEGKPYERDDYILSFRSSTPEDINFIPVEPEREVYHELSDHKPVGLVVSLS